MRPPVILYGDNKAMIAHGGSGSSGSTVTTCFFLLSVSGWFFVWQSHMAGRRHSPKGGRYRSHRGEKGSGRVACIQYTADDDFVCTSGSMGCITMVQRGME